MFRIALLAIVLVLAIHAEAAAQLKPQIGVMAGSAVRDEPFLQVSTFLEQRLQGGPFSLRWSAGYENRELGAGYGCPPSPAGIYTLCVAPAILLTFRGDYVSTGLALKYTAGQGNFRPYAFAGRSVSYRVGKHDLPEPDFNLPIVYSGLQNWLWRTTAGIGIELTGGSRGALLLEGRYNYEVDPPDSYSRAGRFLEVVIGTRF